MLLGFTPSLLYKPENITTLTAQETSWAGLGKRWLFSVHYLVKSSMIFSVLKCAINDTILMCSSSTEYYWCLGIYCSSQYKIWELAKSITTYVRWLCLWLHDSARSQGKNGNLTYPCKTLREAWPLCSYLYNLILSRRSGGFIIEQRRNNSLTAEQTPRSIALHSTLNYSCITSCLTFNFPESVPMHCSAKSTQSFYELWTSTLCFSLPMAFNPLQNRSGSLIVTLILSKLTTCQELYYTTLIFKMVWGLLSCL